MLSLVFAMSLLQDPVGPLPSKNQLDWHKRQYYAFVHFGPNTFTGVEWGQGTENPDVFNPTELDCRQWCRVFKEAGMSGVILTAKHHDGFALWQSKQTRHGVMSSKWRDGKGDVLKELSEACKEYGLWLGVYLSPWDRNHPTYGTPEYNDTFVAMLEEVLTKYGDIKEVWFDGANGEGPNGKRQVYDWPRFEATVRKFAPNAVIFGDGGDVRWVGNEQGFVGETNWNFLPSGHWPGDQSIYHLLNEGDPKGDKYSPGECDVSIRPGWFWRESENDKVKSLEQLQEIWYRSVGHGGNLLLNVPPDTRGLIHESDIRALGEFKRWRDALMSEDFAKGAKLSMSSIPRGSFGVNNLIDGDEETYWMTRDGTSEATVGLRWETPTIIDHIEISEPIRLGQRIDKILLTVGDDTGNKVIVEGRTVGYRRVFRFPAVAAQNASITLRSRSGSVALSSIKALLGPPDLSIEPDATSFLGHTRAILRSNNPFAVLTYTLDGSTPNRQSTVYRGPIAITESCVLKAVALQGGRSSAIVSQSFTKYDRATLWPATVFFRAPDPGLQYSYYPQRLQTLDQLKDLKAAETGVSLKGLDLDLRKQDANFALAFDGVVSVPQDAIITFSLTSDDGSRLYIDDKLVIDNDGLHGMVTKEGIAPLASGYHRLRVEYFNATGGMGLKLEWRGAGVNPGELSADSYRH